MKIFTSIVLALTSSIPLLAQTTMCFKENYPSMTTIQSAPLDGGLCSSKKSVTDMKKDGWKIDDIKIEKAKEGHNYIYVFKKQNNSLTKLDEEKLEQKILQRLEKRKREEQLIKKTQIKLSMSKDGKELYIKKCQTCHGVKAAKLYGPSRALNTLNYFDFKTTLRDYNLGQYNRGQAFIMFPYAKLMSSKDIKNVYSYIQTLKPVKKEEK